LYKQWEVFFFKFCPPNLFIYFYFDLPICQCWVRHRSLCIVYRKNNRSQWFIGNWEALSSAKSSHFSTLLTVDNYIFMFFVFLAARQLLICFGKESEVFFFSFFFFGSSLKWLVVLACRYIYRYICVDNDPKFPNYSLAYNLDRYVCVSETKAPRTISLWKV